ncbi:MAG: 5'-3' exonuclease H3TH domain-containing protein, partial [Patescibacteria group bacterium]
MTHDTKKFVIIDGHALLHRAWHALPPLTTKDGTLVNAVYGFTSIMLTIIKDLKPEYGAVAFDVAGGTFRHESYKEYKATREKAPDELYAQIQLIKEVAAAFGFRIEEHKGFEADDVLGTLANQASRHGGLKTFIVTGDMDAMQLVDKHTVVYTLKKGLSDTVVYDPAGVKEKYGFGPEQVIEFKALAGDSSDNIPGVPGVGEKTAKDLLSKFDSIDDIYKYLEKGGGDKIKETLGKKLLENKESAYMSHELATIKCDLDIKFKPSEFAVKPAEKEHLFELFRKLEFRTLLNRAQTMLGGLPAHTTPSPLLKEEGIGNQQGLFGANKAVVIENFKIRDGYHLVDTKDKAEKLAKKLAKTEELAIDTETDSLGGITSNMIGLALCAKAGEAYYVLAPVVEPLRQILENAKIKKYGHNIKYDLEVLRHAGYEVGGLDFDTKIAAYLMQPSSRSHTLDNLAFVEL